VILGRLVPVPFSGGIIVIEPVLDLMLDRVHAMAHVTLPYALRRRCIEQAPALRKR
jgi:hypothetical protein